MGGLIVMRKMNDAIFEILEKKVKTVWGMGYRWKR